MGRRTLEDHVAEAMQGAGWLEASRIKDRVWEKMRGRSPSIREINAVLRSKRFDRKEKDVIGGQVKKYRIKNAPEKKL